MSVIDRDNLYRLFNWFVPTERQSTRAHIMRGFGKSFLAYLIPFTLLSKGNFSSNLRRAVALGIFVAGVRASDDILTKLKDQTFKKGEEDTDVEAFVKKYSLGVAAMLSAFVAIIVDGEIQHSITLILWIVVRALRPLMPDIPYGSVLVMCITASQNLSTWIMADDHNPAYRAFLNQHGGKSKEVLTGLRNNILAKDTCLYVHPGIGCAEHTVKFFYQSLFRSLRLYIPLSLSIFIFSSSRNINKTIIGLIRSTLFLSLYCTVAWTSLCAASRIRGNSPFTRSRTFIHAGLAGLATIVESKSRQAELAAYCATYALETIYRYLLRRKLVTLYPTLNTFIVALSAGLLLHHRDQHPQAVMRWLFKLGSGSLRPKLI